MKMIKKRKVTKWKDRKNMKGRKNRKSSWRSTENKHWKDAMNVKK